MGWGRGPAAARSSLLAQARPAILGARRARARARGATPRGGSEPRAREVERRGWGARGALLPSRHVYIGRYTDCLVYINQNNRRGMQRCSWQRTDQKGGLGFELGRTGRACACLGELAEPRGPPSGLTPCSRCTPRRSRTRPWGRRSRPCTSHTRTWHTRCLPRPWGSRCSCCRTCSRRRTSSFPCRRGSPSRVLCVPAGARVWSSGGW